MTVEYRESVYVGYRWFDKAGIPVRFPFGHGLSYTAFVYSDLSVDKKRLKCGDGLGVSLTVRNAGNVTGAETVQLYVRDAGSAAFRPEKELKGFEKVKLEPGEKKRVAFALGKRAFAYWNPEIDDWHAESGEFEILAGSSSADIRLREKVFVETDRPDAPVPDLRAAAPAYYDAASAARGIGGADFRALYGRGLPPAGKPRGARFTPTDALDDVRVTLVGKLLFRAVCVEAKKGIGAGNDPLGRKMTDRFAGYMPLRNLATMGDDAMSQRMLNLLMKLMNLGRK